VRTHTDEYAEETDNLGALIKRNFFFTNFSPSGRDFKEKEDSKELRNDGRTIFL
jgi:hypothetical protein